MTSTHDRFATLATEHAPGQEIRQQGDRHAANLRGEQIDGVPVDFSHGDVDADAFPPAPGALDAFVAGAHRGSSQAYTEYRGDREVRDAIAERLAAFTARPISGAEEVIIAPGTQGALFLALAATVNHGDRVAIVRPDYFANRKLVEFLGGVVVPVRIDYLSQRDGAGLDLEELEATFRSGAKTFVFSNPNNPTGVVYSPSEIERIADLASQFGVTVVVDQLYSRMVYSRQAFTHLRRSARDASQVITIMGPSKTESLSGYRLGVAVGAASLVDRMEQLQAIVSLRAPGYSQAVLRTWFAEPAGWLEDRIARHETIRDDLVQLLVAVPGLSVRVPAGGSYLFPRLPELAIPLHGFVRALRVQAGVTVTPGTEFTTTNDSIRLNFSQNHGAAVAAIERMAEMVARYRR